MLSNHQREIFMSSVENGCPPLREQPLLGISALMTMAAFTRPTLQMEIFDAIDQGLAAGADTPSPPATCADYILQKLPWLAAPQNPIPLPPALWEDFWKIIEVPTGDLDGELDLTLRVVALGTRYDQRIVEECEAALLQFDAVKNLLTQPEIRLKNSDLENHPDDHLATILLRMLQNNGYDIEVIDADTVLLDGPYPAQNRTNRRILQLHDVWHLVGGYGFTGAGEVAISGFQLAQFGQNYSTRFLATVATKAAYQAPDFAPLLLQVMFDGWRHGRSVPALIDQPWHKLIAEPISQIRTTYGISPIKSAAIDLMEALSAGNLTPPAEAFTPAA